MSRGTHLCSLEMKIKSVGKCACLAVDWSAVTDREENSKLVLDIRDQQRFAKSHIRNSVNFIVSNLLLRRVQRGTLPITSLLNMTVKNSLSDDYCSKIVVVDEKSKIGSETNEIQVVTNALRKEYPSKIVCFLDGGFEEFQSSHPSWCEYNQPKSPYTTAQIAGTPFKLKIDEREESARKEPVMDTSPVRILPFVYLGNESHASKRDVLDRIGVTAILNVAKSCPEYFREVYTYKHIPLEDNDSQDISAYFNEAIKFIDEVKRKQGVVLVHCRAGISRSASICIAYLMKKHQFTMDQAYEFTKQRRSSISPNLNFLGQLLAFEAELLRENQERTFLSIAPKPPNVSTRFPERTVAKPERRVSTGTMPKRSNLEGPNTNVNGYPYAVEGLRPTTCIRHVSSSDIGSYENNRPFSLPEIEDPSAPIVFTYPPHRVSCSPIKATRSPFNLVLTPS